ncbi:2-dehydropantoate 2-reductase [Caldibacillus thermolactis]|jgi:2-dehydropantoate 2-reductase|uniref:2-dehydropantoate 2-reductase n=1 Tax=Pallidibacillus thermolactis TaxID=251051 RepID=A0ABT2WH82_9BACI|nr:2-dehydropantoate 2-reductase [Pallidibacillus thermolactis]MCU9595039.1 2-dehydropantoate 2-reductase [Pallidibacillus thermolactis]
MKIGIIGGGSIGLLYACYLSKHHKVTLYCRRISQANKINRHPIRLKKQYDEQLVPIQAKVSETLDHEELIIVCVKHYHLESLMPILLQTDKNTILIFLQNGIGHLSQIEKLPHKHILVGVVEHGAMKENDRVVRHTGDGVTRFSIFKGTEEKIRTVKEQISTEDFPFIIEKDYWKMLKHKLLVNAVINPLTALLNIKNGQLLTNPFYNYLFQQFYMEVASILQISNKEEVYQYLQTVCQNTAENESSMLRDLKLNNRMEIDGILTPLIEKAEKNNLHVPFLLAAYEALCKRNRT